MEIVTKLNPETKIVTIDLETDENIIEISLGLDDIEKNIKATSDIANNIIIQKSLEFLSSLLGIKLTFKKKEVIRSG